MKRLQVLLFIVTIANPLLSRGQADCFDLFGENSKPPTTSRMAGAAKSPAIPESGRLFSYVRDADGRLSVQGPSANRSINNSFALVRDLKESTSSSIVEGNSITLAFTGFSKENTKALVTNLRRQIEQDRQKNIIAFLTRTESQSAIIARLAERKYDWTNPKYEWTNDGRLLIEVARTEQAADSIPLKIAVYFADLVAELPLSARSQIQQAVTEVVRESRTDETIEILNKLRLELESIRDDTEIRVEDTVGDLIMVDVMGTHKDYQA